MTEPKMTTAVNTIRVLNPATGQELSVHEEFTDGGIEAVLAEAHAAQAAWRSVSFAERRRLMPRRREPATSSARLVRGRDVHA
jgi:acyl-CoA reductase-like NAD-dependent aldehyde dehydrogenase